MSIVRFFDKDRQVIPRWHTYSLARWLRMTLSGRSENEQRVQDEGYDQLISLWEAKKELAYGADLVGNALALNAFGDPAAVEAANLILKNKAYSGLLLSEVAENYLRLSYKTSLPVPEIIVPERDKKFYKVISNLKSRVREYPHNPILWMDLAFFYSAIGQIESASHAVSVSLSLNRDNRYLLRSASRFYIHAGSPDKALYYVRQSNLIQHDPWMVAAEIAITDSIGKSSKRMKLGNSMLENAAFPKLHLSELASAMATIELKSGAKRKGRKLFGLALEDPTENALAQATSMQDEIGDLRERLDPGALAQSFEADARIKFNEQDFEGSLEASKKWFAYQPFSSRPAVTGSYIASVALGQFEEAVKIAKMGLLSSPKEFMLKNNLAAALASLGRASEAAAALSNIDENQLKEREKATLTATRGKIAFREGNAEIGRALYESAIEIFKKEKDLRAEALATFFWAREEGLINSPTSGLMQEKAIRMAKRLNLFELLPSPEKTDEATVQSRKMQPGTHSEKKTL